MTVISEELIKSIAKEFARLCENEKDGVVLCQFYENNEFTYYGYVCVNKSSGEPISHTIDGATYIEGSFESTQLNVESLWAVDENENEVEIANYDNTLSRLNQKIRLQ